MKFFKNKNRSIQKNHKPYVPFYKEHNISPEVVEPQNSFVVSLGSRINPRENLHPPVRTTPYADVGTPTIKGQVPNNGNNVEQMWVSVKSNANELYTVDSAISEEDIVIDDVDLHDSDFTLQSEQNANFDFSNLDEYSVFVFNSLFATGSLEEVQKEVKSLLYGDDDNIKNVTENDIVILKKVPIKIGVFIDG